MIIEHYETKPSTLLPCQQMNHWSLAQSAPSFLAMELVCLKSRKLSRCLIFLPLVATLSQILISLVLVSKDGFLKLVSLFLIVILQEALVESLDA